CTSFFPSKNLACFGDGGAILTNDKNLGEKLRMIANHGQKIKYHYDLVGVNSRLDTLQAAVLQVKLKHLNHYTASRQEAARHYDEALTGIEGLLTPARMENGTHAFNQYTLQIKNGKRDALKAFLQEKGVPSMIYYPLPLHLQKAYEYVGHTEGAFPEAEKLSKSVLSLPVHTEINTEQLDYICASVREFFEQKAVGE